MDGGEHRSVPVGGLDTEPGCNERVTLANTWPGAKGVVPMDKQKALRKD